MSTLPRPADCTWLEADEIANRLLQVAADLGALIEDRPHPRRAYLRGHRTGQLSAVSQITHWASFYLARKRQLEEEQ